MLFVVLVEEKTNACTNNDSKRVVKDHAALFKKIIVLLQNIQINSYSAIPT